jgi:hypothetical protein
MLNRLLRQKNRPSNVVEKGKDMRTFTFPVGASETRGESWLWELDFDVTDEEADRLKLYAEESTALSEIKEISDISDRLYSELLNYQAGIYEEDDDSIKDVAEYLNKPMDEIGREDVLEYLESLFSFRVYFPEEMIPVEED